VTRRDLSERADRLRTLLIFTVLQAFLLTLNPHLLPMWGDEANTVHTVARPVGEILQLVRTDIHPPLYFLLAHFWLALTGAKDPLTALRLLSAFYAVCATILLERLWLREFETETRQWVLLLWAFSPCMLLFGRMARSYSLQTLLTVLAIWAVLRFAEESSSWKRLAALAASLTALLYTHYLPGIAIWAAANVFLLHKVGRTPWSAAGPPAGLSDQAKSETRGNLLWRMWLLPNLLVAAAYAPWIATLSNALPRWSHKDLYSLTSNAVIEPLLKLAYGSYSLAFGEAIPLWLLALSALLAGPYIWLLAQTARNHRQWLLPAAATALLAYIGAAHWVSYPFMGARLLFLLPLLLVAVATGIGEQGRFGTIFGIALFAANTGGVWSYFGTRDIINIAYVAPHRQIAAAIVLRSSPADTVVWVDGLNVDDSVLADYLPAGFAVRVLRSGADADAAWDELQRNPGIRHIWFIRSPHDISPGHAFEKLEQRMLATSHVRTLHPYVPASETYRLALKLAMHEPQPPRYVYQVWEFRR
jgi:hypothetical protein